MGARRRKGDESAEVKPKHVRKRPRRSGPKRTVNVHLLAEIARRLDVDAAENLTTPGEIVMDALEARWREAWRSRRSDSADGVDSSAA